MRNYYLWAAILFMLTGAWNIRSGDFSQAAIWIAIGALFLSLFMARV